MDELILQEHNVPGRGEIDLLKDICAIVDSARSSVAKHANSEITLMNWYIGERINREILGNTRAEYGKQIVSRLATQLSWSHFIEVLPIKEPLQREFYLTVAASEHWSRNLMREKIDGMLYERTAISRKPEEMISRELANLRDNNVMTPDLVFKSPYFLDFTGLTGFYSEKDLEDVLISQLEKFLLELGNGFTFVARQKRMIIDGEDFYLDLLFYHRKLHRLIAVDLKTRKFRAQDKGQMELYLRYLDKYEKEPCEESPLGMLLCSEGSDEQIELLQLDEAGIKVAQYFTELPSKDVLKKYIAQQKNIAVKQLENKEDNQS